LGRQENALREARSILNSIPRSKRQDYAMMCYNYAGILALAGRSSEAIQYLRLALDYGYADYEWLIRDINFGSLVKDRDFTYLLRQFGMTYIAGNRAPEVVIINQKTNDFPPNGNSTKIKSGALTFIDDNGNGKLETGENGYITFKIINDGPGTARDVEVRVRDLSGSYGLNFARYTLIGDIYARDTRDVRINIQATDEMLDGKANFQLSVQDENGFGTNTMEIKVPLSTAKSPVLEVVDHHFASDMGGVMRPGVPAILKLAIKNQGQGTANGVLLDFLLPKDVYTAGNDKFDLGDIRPGESRIVDFEFFTSRKYELESVELQALIKNSDRTYSQKQTFIVKVNQELERNDRVVIRNDDSPKNPDIPKGVELVSDVDVNLPRTGNKNPNAIAVVIGNRDYNNRDVPSVDYALNDALAMKKYLVESYGFDPNNILYLENATQADFNGIFGTKDDHKARLFNLVRPNVSDVFVFYSGHGAPDLESEEAFFVPVDCDPSLVRFNGYAINTFYENLAKIPYKSITVVIDACFSGASAKGTLIPRASLVRVKSKPSTILTDPKAAVFTSATGTQIASWYPEQSHGLFTYYFLKGIQGEANKNRDRVLTVSEMKAYIDNEVPYQARRMNNRVQTPETYGKDDSVIFDY
ncbi:MAG: caspase family protein, partial [Bacteroidia bacterium]|nr:caspase family protein [Bacteroidia bacterium]